MDVVQTTVAEPALLAVAAALALVLTVDLRASPTSDAWLALEGFRAGEVVERARLRPDQPTAWYTGAVVQPASWLGYGTRRPVDALSEEAVRSLAAERPDDLVFVGRVQCDGAGPRLAYALERAADVLRSPPSPVRCPG